MIVAPITTKIIHPTKKTFDKSLRIDKIVRNLSAQYAVEILMLN